MLITIVDDMRSFILVLLIFVLSFAVAFVIYNADITQSVTDDVGGVSDENSSILDAIVFVLNLAVFGQSSGYSLKSEQGEYQPPKRTLNTFLFVFLMVTVNIILLNLLIAIMADSYTRVNRFAERGLKLLF